MTADDADLVADVERVARDVRELEDAVRNATQLLESLVVALRAKGVSLSDLEKMTGLTRGRIESMLRRDDPSLKSAQERHNRRRRERQRDREMAPTSNGRIGVKKADAARLLGISRPTLDSWITSGRIQVGDSPDGRPLVTGGEGLESLIERFFDERFADLREPAPQDI